MTNRLFSALVCITALTLAGCSDDSDSNVEQTPKTPLLDNYVLSSTNSVPEGIAFDPQTRTFYATSLQGASITRIAADGTESLFREADNRARLGGVKIDAGNRLLWVCATAVDGTDDRVWVYDLESGELDTEFLLGAISTNGSCNDLVLDPSGIAYVTDPANPNLYRLDRATGEGTVLASDPRFQDITGLNLGLNGIDVTPEGDALIVAKFAPPSLYRVSLPNGDDIAGIELSGDEFPTPDGLEFIDGDLYSVANANVSRTRFTNNHLAGTVVTRDYRSGLSTAATAEGELYVIKSEVTNFVLGGDLQLPFEIFRIPLTDFDSAQATAP